MSGLMNQWLAVTVAVYLVSMMLMGHHRGFIRLAVSMVSLVITLLIVNVTLPRATEYLRDNAAIHKMVEQGVKTISDGIISNEETPDFPAQQRMIIENLNLPDQIKDALIENNNSEVYQMLGVNAFTDYISSYLTNIIINAIVFLVLFFLIRLVLHILVRWLDLIAKLPILSGLNKIAGAVLGLAEGLVFFWIFCLVITVFSNNSFSAVILEEISNSKWLTVLYANNIFNKIILGLFSAFII